MFRSLAFASVVALIASPVVGGDGVYVTTQDLEAAERARKSVEDNCGGGFRGHVDRDDARGDLETGVGGDNFVLTTLRKAQSQSELQDVFMDEISYTTLAWKGAPLVSGVVMLLIWASCCWTFWGFCKRCRCCVDERETASCVKYCAMLVVLVLLAGVGVGTLLSVRGYTASTDGFDNMVCASAELLDSSLSGQTSPSFIGLLPLLEEIDGLDKQLETGSAFLANLTEEIDRTQEIEDAVKVAAGVLKLLEDMMALEQNQAPRHNGEDLLHTCRLCQDAPGKLAPAIEALEGSVAGALADVRAEVETQLGPEKREGLQRDLRENVKPLLEAKDFIRDVFSYFIDTNRPLQDVKDQLNGSVPGVLLAVIFLVAAAVLLLCCGCSSLFMFISREKAYSNNQTVLPYSQNIPRCAALTWCCGFLYTILAFSLGGALHVVSVPMSGLCLIMDGMDNQTLHDIAPALDLNIEGDSGAMVADIIDQCLVPATASATASLLDIIVVTSNGSKITMRKKLDEDINDQITARFDEIERRMQNLSALSLANNSGVTELQQLVRDNNVSALIIADKTRMDADGQYDALASGPLAVGYATSAACPNHTFEGEEIPGIEYFVSVLEGFGAAVQSPASPACARQVVCGANPLTAEMCAAGNRVVDLKRKLYAAEYRCDLFESPNGSPCDPAAMERQGGGYAGDCLVGGAMERRARTCGLEEFVAYVHEFDTRIGKAMRRIDDAVQNVTASINITLRELVHAHVTGPIDEIADGTTCGWMSQHYQKLVDGMCFQGVWGVRNIGVSYIWCSCAVVVLIVLMYALWRRSLDNVNEWKREAQVSI
eukprot:CAMPEP_0179226042 /NCGR_PEP_ID=MMETSP0797-20121207/8611_1 /TAXON_ID=47934 /ORGANISM="Dinophysis acuminata, Strain DAEP01" /LENGTH=826 /DNA_ID=CAMNT_0020933061 /DNA_START=96 /DNA_END=2576 /DNA_ORIENTATION=-